MTIKNLLAPNKNAIWIAFLWTFLILYLSLRNAASIPKVNFANADKIVPDLVRTHRIAIYRGKTKEYFEKLKAALK